MQGFQGFFIFWAVLLIPKNHYKNHYKGKEYAGQRNLPSFFHA